MAEDGWAEAQEEQQKVVEDAAKEREESGDNYDPDTQGFRDEDDVKQHAAHVPGIFGDTPTDPTIGDTVVVTKNEEVAGQNVAEADASGDDEAEDASVGEVKRQTDAAGRDEFAEDVDEAADDDNDDEDDDNN